MKKTEFPRLYKKTSTGKIQIWDLYVEGATMYSESGQLDGKKIKSEDTIKEGKNIGKANETTPEEQARLEAGARWTGKKKKGYVEMLDSAEEGKVDEDVIEGGLNPTLAKSYDKDKKHIVFPCAAQPKLDGIRSIHDKKKLWSRTRKEIISVPHINAALAKAKPLSKHDGELYNHDFKHDFEKITHLVGQKTEPAEGHEVVQYHVYDLPVEGLPFRERMKKLETWGSLLPKDSPIKIVQTIICNNEEELKAAYIQFMEQGYEGAMVRNLDAEYEFKRSFHLQKMKEFEDAEFNVIGVEEGRGKLKGHAGAFLCINELGVEFKAKMSGSTSKLKEYWKNRKDYVGQKLTVQFQGLTGKNKVPRFPVGLRIRKDE